MRSLLSRTVSRCFCILRQLRTIQCSVLQSVFQSLVIASVLTKVEFGNAMLDCLQAVMNAAARIVIQTSRYDHITPLLRCLYWLCVPQGISFKLAVVVYQCVHGLGLAYLADALQPVARIPGRQRLQSSSTSALDIPSTWLSTVGDRAFSVAAARTWNSLLAEVTSPYSLQTFKTTRKSHFFGIFSTVSKLLLCL